MSTEDLRKELEAGRSLPQIARSRGVPETAIVSAIEARLYSLTQPPHVDVLA